MDRKGIIGIALAVIGLVCWQVYFTRATQRALRAQEAQAAAQAAQAAAQGAATPGPNPGGAPATPVTPPPTVQSSPPAGASANPAVESAAVPEQLQKIVTESAQYFFTNRGAGLARVVLLKHAAEKEAKVVMNEFGKIPIAALVENAGQGTSEPFEMTLGERDVTFVHADARNLEIRKKFSLPRFETLDGKARLREEYRIRLDVGFTNRGGQPVQLPAYYVHTGAATSVHHADLPIYTGFNWLRGGSNKFVDVNWFSAGGFLMFSHPERPVYTETSENVGYAGVTNQYFTALVTPIVDDRANSDVQQQQRGASVWAQRISVPEEAWKAAGHSVNGKAAPHYGVDGALGMRGFTLKPGASWSQAFDLYVGPREYRRLDALGHHEDQIMDFGIFGVVSRTLLVSMNMLRGWLGNYAWAIVVLTLIIKTAMWPLQNKATNSMKRMQALQPKMNELREKYKDDPTKMNTELMRLYKEYGINPFGGCLPMLVQIPIFFGFYNMLGKAVELRNARFLWVSDLSQPDTIARIFSIPINPLPLLMAVTMFWQMAISPKSGDPVQQRVFMFVPLIFIFFCYNFASALALYWTVQNLFSIVQLYATRNKAAPTLQKVALPAKKKPRG
jgi:YidC/Oxa1 family membrane protein insertase